MSFASQDSFKSDIEDSRLKDEEEEEEEVVEEKFSEEFIII